MARGVQDRDLRIPQFDDVSSMVQSRLGQLRAPELRLRTEEMQLGVMHSEHVVDTVDVIVMTVGEQDICDAHAFALCQGKQLGHVPRGVDDRRPVASVIVDEVDEIFHRPKFQGFDAEGCFATHVFAPASLRATRVSLETQASASIQRAYSTSAAALEAAMRSASRAVISPWLCTVGEGSAISSQ